MPQITSDPSKDTGKKNLFDSSLTDQERRDIIGTDILGRKKSDDPLLDTGAKTDASPFVGAAEDEGAATEEDTAAAKLAGGEKEIDTAPEEDAGVFPKDDASPQAEEGFTGIQDPTSFKEVKEAEDEIIKRTEDLMAGSQAFLNEMSNADLDSIEKLKEIGLDKYSVIAAGLKEVIEMNRRARDEIKVAFGERKKLLDVVAGRDKSRKAAAVLNRLRSRGIDLSNPNIVDRVVETTKVKYQDQLDKVQADYNQNISSVIERFAAIETSLREQERNNEDVKFSNLDKLEELRRTLTKTFLESSKLNQEKSQQTKIGFGEDRRKARISQAEAEIEKSRTLFPNLSQKGKVDAVFEVIKTTFAGADPEKLTPQMRQNYLSVISEEVQRGGSYADVLKRAIDRVKRGDVSLQKEFVHIDPKLLFNNIKQGRVRPDKNNPDWNKYSFEAREKAFKMWEDHLSQGGTSEAPSRNTSNRGITRSPSPGTETSGGSSTAPTSTRGTTDKQKVFLERQRIAREKAAKRNAQQKAAASKAKSRQDKIRNSAAFKRRKALAIKRTQARQKAKSRRTT